MRKLYLLAATLTAMIVLTGCGSSEERNHPLFKKGESAQKAGNGADAAAAYKELIDKREGCVYTHLQLANVYDELLNDPLMAAAHYRTYLEKNPQATDAGEIQALLDRAEKRYYENLRQKFGFVDTIPADTDQARIEELERNANIYRARYEEMRKEVQLLRKKNNSNSGKSTTKQKSGKKTAK